jgi:tRNA A37 threonylcarbamoyladenosine modification protein TsaB
MTNYHLTPPATLSTLLSLAAQEKKEKRQKVLAAVRHRRSVIYQQFYTKHHAQKQSRHVSLP